MDGNSSRPQPRAWIAWLFTAAEDIVYLGLGVLLAGCALVLLCTGFIDFGESAMTGKLSVVDQLDRILLVLLVVELLYTVKLSFHEHALIPEPFLLVGLISAVRRVLLLTAQFDELHERNSAITQHFAVELLVLTGLILALAIAFVLLRSRTAKATADQG